MATAHRPTYSTAFQAAGILYKNAIVPIGGLLSGSAVGIRNIDDQLTFFEVGALAVNSPMSLIGFLEENVNAGSKAKVITGRGSVITPRVVGAIPMVPEQPVYLSVEPGLVTQVPIDSDVYPGATSQPVGYAVTATTMIFNTDTQLRYGG